MDAAGIELDEHPMVAEQLKAADVVILNNIDLVEIGSLATVREKIKLMIPGDCMLLETSFGRIDFDQIFTAIHVDSRRQRNYGKPPSKNFNSTAGYATISFVHHKPIHLNPLLRLYDACGAKIIRSKGFLVTEKGGLELRLSNSGIELKDTRKPIKRTELVLITRERDKVFVEDKFREFFDSSDP